MTTTVGHCRGCHAYGGGHYMHCYYWGGIGGYELITDYSKMESGPELDALVAEKVLGWERYEFDLWVDAEGTTIDMQPFSTTWEGAELVVDRADYWELKTTRIGETQHFECWYHTQVSGANGHAFAPTAPLAICRAALLSVSDES